MKKLFISLLLTQSIVVQAQEMSSLDSIQHFYEQLLGTLESRYLFSEEVAWEDIRTYTLSKALKATSFQTALAVSSDLFDSIRCNHCYLFAGANSYGSTLNRQITAEDLSKPFIERYNSGQGHQFEVKLIKETIGYINMPGMLFLDLSQDSLNIKTQALYDQIVALKAKTDLQGWIVDLRFNTGGDARMNLAALYDLIGDKVVYTGLDKDEKKSSVNELIDGGFYTDDSLQIQVKPSTPPNTDLPTALITSIMTASSGEDVAVAFKNNKKATLIGEPTYGFLTGNDLFDLPFELKAALTISYIADAKYVYRPKLIPDVLISKKDNFADPIKDENIKAAIRFIEGF